ncbi:hypothetical protein [Methylobacterium sp. R2-1]|uniref:hypothetical protein n=1 Tax=Methylobacterium sp. R2-1 TaxID=2587064 RepID=UPI00161864EF|nr:hypothetical protein [Methylobacterium sp. R2-1]MBB2961885.1 hypothetical protein [Methylobacterium sp. R2-1]
MSNVTDTSASGASIPAEQPSQYTGLADWAYHRDSADQGFSLGDLGFNGTFQPFADLTKYGFQISAADGFIYNPAVPSHDRPRHRHQRTRQEKRLVKRLERWTNLLARESLASRTADRGSSKFQY